MSAAHATLRMYLARSANHVKALSPEGGFYWVRATATESRDLQPWCIVRLDTVRWDSTGQEQSCREWWGDPQPGLDLPGYGDDFLVDYEIIGPLPEPTE